MNLLASFEPTSGGVTADDENFAFERVAVASPSPDGVCATILLQRMSPRQLASGVVRADHAKTRRKPLARGEGFPLALASYFAFPQVSAVSGVHTSTPVTIIGSSFLPAKTSTRDFTAVYAMS
jgi:hypothetical protein